MRARLRMAAGVELVDIELRQATLVVTVERGSATSTSTRFAEVAQAAISAALDEHDELAPGAPFELEVSSPGVERLLRRPEHFARALGATVALRTQPGTPGERRVEGELLAIERDGIVITLRRRRWHSPRRLRARSSGRTRVFDWRLRRLCGDGGATPGESTGSQGSPRRRWRSRDPQHARGARPLPAPAHEEGEEAEQGEHDELRIPGRASADRAR